MRLATLKGRLTEKGNRLVQHVRDSSGNSFLSASAKNIVTDNPTAAAAETQMNS